MTQGGDPTDATNSPPRAFTQGVGTVFQFVGVIVFLAGMSVCCGSGLYYRTAGERRDLTLIGWRFGSPKEPGELPSYSAQQAITISLAATTFLGLAMSGVGLGLQAQNRVAPIGALVVTGVGAVFWAVHFVFAVQILQSVSLGLLAFLLLAAFVALFLLSLGAAREMRRDPPPEGHEILPAGYKVPYSHMHDDPPEVRLARELEQRRQRLAVEQKEMEMLEARLKRRLRETAEGGDNNSGRG